jgi:hypothetical protein
MTPAATAEKPPEAPESTELGSLNLFLPEDYKVKKLEATLSGITVAVDANHPLYGLVEGDELDVVIRGVVVTGTKTHKGDVTLILYGDDIDVLRPRGLPSNGEETG